MPSTTELAPSTRNHLPPDPRYVELRCRSAFSFLRGATLPEELVARGQSQGYTTLAITDRAGLYAVPRFFKAATAAGITPLAGAELTVDERPLLLLCETPLGYRNLSRLITSEKRGASGVSFDELSRNVEGLIALSGGSEGTIGEALDHGDDTTAKRNLARYAELFGRERFFVELQIHLEEEEDRRNIALLRLARALSLPLVATNDVHCASPEQALIADVLACVRHGVTLTGAGTRLARNGERYLKSPAAMVALFRDLPEAVDNTRLIASRCHFTLRDLNYRFPDFPLPENIPDQPAFLRDLVERAAEKRFVPYGERARAQIDRELTLIAKLGLTGYFLVVWDIVEYCRKQGILAQGRGSAANSAVCYALGITACDPLKMDLLFERFLSEERGEWPDIDLDLPSGAARESIIQYLYKKYGPHGCAMTGSVITYRERSAARDLAKVFDLPVETALELAATVAEKGIAGLPAGSAPELSRFAEVFLKLQDLPRHFAQHPGGMIVAAGRLDEVVPLEPASMAGRVVMQWDKDDCADRGLIKIDLLGLGMLAALDEARRLVPRHDGVPFELHSLPPDDEATYRLIANGDTVGVFQIESRAQMAILPRTQPRCFYDLVVQVGLIRPGPIIGNMVHPYLRRRAGKEPVRYLHPSLRPILERTLGVPLFQEQIMRVAMVAAGFTGGQADELRRAMDSKRSRDKMEALVQKLRDGMAKNGISGLDAEEIVQAITAFAAYGFPESHAISFAYLTYASAYLKAHHSSAFFASLLNAWPMGFYHPSTLVKDAQRHGVRVRPVDVSTSEWRCTLEASSGNGTVSAVRLGLRYVRGLSQQAGEALCRARDERPFSNIGDVRRRCPELSAGDMQTLASIGAFVELEGNPSRRTALWQVSAMPERGGLLAGAVAEDGSDEKPLRDMDLAERIGADYQGTSLTVGPHPLALARKGLSTAGFTSSRELSDMAAWRRLRVAGICIVAQRPPTARGFCFLTLEDEHGLINVIVPPDVCDAHAGVIWGPSGRGALVVEGVMQRQEGALSIKAEKIRPLD